MMFSDFFKTQIENTESIDLFGDKPQKHTIIFKQINQVEYFELDKIIKECKKIKELLSCDYVIADHSSKKILLCELKNSKNADTIRRAKEQLKHSQNIINLFLSVLNQTDYKFSQLIFSKRTLNKQTTKRKIINKKPLEVNLLTINFDDLKYD